MYIYVYFITVYMYILLIFHFITKEHTLSFEMTTEHVNMIDHMLDFQNNKNKYHLVINPR